MICKNCIDKQLKIDALENRIEHLENQLRHQKRKEKEGLFGSSTPSSQIPLKSNSSEENQNKKGGAKPGHKGNGRRAITENEADIIENCLTE